MKKRKEFMMEFDVKYYTEEEVENEEGKDDKGKPIFSKETVNIPHKINVGIKNPTRRQMDDASLEYSAFFGKCMKLGCLTKAMLAKQYADQGGAMNEEDAKILETLYKEVDRLNNKIVVFNEKVSRKPEMDIDDYNALSHMSYEITRARRQIIDLEGSYLSLFQTTAEIQAQSRLILWYMIHLTYVKKNNEWKPYFDGESFDERCDSYYYYEENEDEHETYEKIKGRVAMILGFWLLNPTKETDDAMSFLETELETMTEREDFNVENIHEDGPKKTEKEGSPV